MVKPTISRSAQRPYIWSQLVHRSQEAVILAGFLVKILTPISTFLHLAIAVAGRRPVGRLRSLMVIACCLD